jgi:hypothetical protein
LAADEAGRNEEKDSGSDHDVLRMQIRITAAS